MREMWEEPKFKTCKPVDLITGKSTFIVKCNNNTIVLGDEGVLYEIVVKNNKLKYRKSLR